MKKKYPLSLFCFGLVQNMIWHFFYLFFPAIILLIIGIWVRPCLYIGGTLLALDAILSFIEQMTIRRETLNSTNPNFAAFQDAILSPDWKKNSAAFFENLSSQSGSHALDKS